MKDHTFLFYLSACHRKYGKFSQFIKELLVYHTHKSLDIEKFESLGTHNIVVAFVQNTWFLSSGLSPKAFS